MTENTKRRIKLYYHEDGRLLYSRVWPDVPPVQGSIYKDELMLSQYKKSMRFLTQERLAVLVTNPDKAFEQIVWNGSRINRNEFYEIETDFAIHRGANDRYTMTIL